MLIEILLFICGVYVLGQSIRMKVTGQVPKGLINPKVNLKNAPDIEGYIKYTFIRGVIFGAVLILFSGILVLSSLFEGLVPTWLILISELMYIVVLIYYAVVSVKAQNKYLFKVSREDVQKRRSDRIKRATAYVNPETSEADEGDTSADDTTVTPADDTNNTDNNTDNNLDQEDSNND